MSTFYISTPIYYPTDEPHVGHVYTTLCADTLARYHRLAGEDTFFLTGTDEHGVKMVKEAEKKGLSPQQLADSVAPVYARVWAELSITNDDFIRTTEVRHKGAAQRIVEKLLASDDIYLGSYEGWYDEGQEEFVTETDAKANDYKSAISKRPLTRYSEPTYFFRLGKYVPRVLEHIAAHAEFIRPEGRRNEVISKLKQGVADLSISRATLKWGIPMPHDPAHVLYVWIDALSNYITALGYASEDDDGKFRRYWPANVHLIGKDILWFHAVYWPAMLFALGLEAPKSVVAHGWFKSGGQKMGKSLGNFIDLEKIRAVIGTYGQDSLRYFLLRPVPFGEDPDWSELEIHKAHTELKNVVGNCLNRVLTMVNKYREGRLPAAGGAVEDIDKQLIERTNRLSGELAAAYEKCALQECALLPIELARACNGYIDATKPFSLAKDPAQAGRLDAVLNYSAQGIYRALAALLPILPEKALAGLVQLGVSVEGRTLAELMGTDLPAGIAMAAPVPLFANVETPGK